MRIKNSVLLFLAAILLSGFASDQEPITAEEILSRSKQALLKLQSASYDFNFRSKSTDKYDTSFIEGKVYLEKHAEDTLLGCYFRSTTRLIYGNNNSKAETFYNGKKFLSLSSSAQSAYADSSIGKGFANPNYIKNNYKLNGLLPDLYQVTPFKDALNGDSETSILPAEKIGGRLCYTIKILHKTTDRSVKINYSTVYIDRKTFLPLRKITHVEFENHVQHSDLQLSNLLINNQSILEQIVEPSIPADYEIKSLKRPNNLSYENPLLMKPGTTAPDFELNLLNSKETFKLANLKGKACLLVFWYKGSYPFEAAIPLLDSLHLVFKYKGLQIVGINALDNKKSHQELTDYLTTKTVIYPNGLDKEKTISDQYKVWEYPSIYLIDGNRQILFSHKGYDDGLPARLGEAVEAALK